MITVTASARHLAYASDDIITSGSVGLPIMFNLSADFDGLSVVAVFEGSGVSVDVALMGGDTCVVPHEVLTQAGSYLRIGVYASNEEGTVVIPTVWFGSRMILPGTVPSEADPAAPTPSWPAQVQAAAARALANSEQAIETADGAKEAAIIAQDSASASAVSAASSASVAVESAAQAASEAHNANMCADAAAGYAEQSEKSAQNAGNSANESLANAQAANDASGVAIAAKNAAEAAQSAAEAAQNAAVTAETNAGEHSTTAAAKALEAAQSAENAASNAMLASNSRSAAEIAQTGAESAQSAAETAQNNAEGARDTAEEYRDEVLQAAGGIAQQTTAQRIAAELNAISVNVEELVRINRSIRWYDELPVEGVEGYTYITPDGVFHYNGGEYKQVSGGGSLNGFGLALDAENRVVLSYVNQEDETDTVEEVLPSDSTSAEIIAELQTINEALHDMIPTGKQEGR